MQKNRFALIACFALMGCISQPVVTSSSDSTVVVRAAIPDMGIEEVLPLAEAACKKHGMRARLQMPSGPTTDRYIFACVR
jgi:hypothetical protein